MTLAFTGTHGTLSGLRFTPPTQERAGGYAFLAKLVTSRGMIHPKAEVSFVHRCMFCSVRVRTRPLEQKRKKPAALFKAAGFLVQSYQQPKGCPTRHVPLVAVMIWLKGTFCRNAEVLRLFARKLR